MMMVGSAVVSLARGDELPSKVKPPAVQVTSILHRSALECFALFIGIDAELPQHRTKRRGIDYIALQNEIPAGRASALFREAYRQSTIVGSSRFAIVPDHLIAELQFRHRHYILQDRVLV